MPRTITIKDTDSYRGYEIKDKYRYDKNQLDNIIDALVYYSSLCVDGKSDYVVFDVTFTVEDTSMSPYFDCSNYDDGKMPFNPTDLKSVFPSSHYFYRWTREWSDKFKEHYHMMVIANHVPKTGYIQKIQSEVSKLSGVKSCFISPRLCESDKKIHFHWLNNKDENHGSSDAVNRHSYRAKLDQKLECAKRTFDGCRDLKPLEPLSFVLASRYGASNDKVFRLVAS